MSRSFLNKLSHLSWLPLVLKVDYAFSRNICKKCVPCQYRTFCSKRGIPKDDLVTVDSFEDIRNKNKQSYLEMVEIYKVKETRRRGHVEFIYSALKYMKEFGVEKDLEVYKSLIDVLPKGTMIPRNMFQIEFMHYPKQQQCAIDLLEQMEENGVIPDWNMEDQLVNVFGRKGYPIRRYWRMMYWMPKFKNLSPWPLPQKMPHDTYQLALLAIERITSVDTTVKISSHKTSEVTDSIDDTWIISGQSPDQRDLLARLPENWPLHVEGGFRIWLRNKSMNYFILRANPTRTSFEEEPKDLDDVSNLKLPYFEKPDSSLMNKISVHEQIDGTILAVCATGTSSRDSLLSWIRILEKTNPRIATLPVVFSQRSPLGEVVPTEGLGDGSELAHLTCEKPETSEEKENNP